MTSYLLDTHVLVWWVDGGGRLSRPQRRILDTARSGPFLVSDVTLFELAGLEALGRLRPRLPFREWLTRATAAPRVELVRFTPAVASEMANLSAEVLRDPADRAIVATARTLDVTLMTCDGNIVDSRLCRVMD